MLHSIADRKPNRSLRSFASYLITLVQRLPRYCLFVGELKKFTPPLDPDHTLLSAAYNAVRALTEHVDAETNRAIAFGKINDLSIRLGNPRDFVLFELGRRHIADFPVTLSKRGGAGVLHIFTDSIFLSQKDGRREMGLVFQLMRHFHYFASYDTFGFSEKRPRPDSLDHFALKFESQQTYRTAADCLESNRRVPRSGVSQCVWINTSFNRSLEAMRNAAAWSVNGRLFIAGGEGANGTSNQFVITDLATGSITI
jgi:hypothetical protein